jgi:hypothetical protein
MARKKLPRNIDLASNVDVAMGFFSNPTPTSSESEAEQDKKENVSKTKTASNEKINLGGRPKKEGLKNRQFTLTMNPEMYEKLRIIAEKYTRGNFSGLIDEAIKSFCKEHSIDLSTVQVAPEILDMYKRKQEKKSNEK